jgi:hypothetical protein
VYFLQRGIACKERFYTMAVNVLIAFYSLQVQYLGACPVSDRRTPRSVWHRPTRGRILAG